MADVSVSVGAPSQISVTVAGSSGGSALVTNGSVATVLVTQAGDRGPAGPAGPPYSTITASATTLTAGSSATVVGTSSNNGANLTLAFGIPAGATGATGPAGPTPTITATATTLSAGSNATVTATSTNNGANVTLAFGLPRGANGTGGSSSSLSLSDATPSALGIASAGTSTLASRSDHTHNLPVISYVNLTNVPSTFAPSAHNHTANQITDFSSAVASASLVTAVANRTGSITLTTADISGLDAAISSSSASVIDGGDYIGQLVYGITFGTQPQSVTTNASLIYTLPFSLPSGSYNRVSYANGTYFATPSSGTTLATSPDCVTWTARQSAFATSGDWTEVVYGNGVYVAYRRDTTKYARSTNGTSWSESDLTFTSQYLSVKTISAITYIGGVGFVAFASSQGYNDIGSAMQSSDGVNWTGTYAGGVGVVTGGKTIAVAGGYVHACGYRAQIANGTLSTWSQIGSEGNVGRLLVTFAVSGQKVFGWGAHPNGSNSYTAIVGAIDYGGDSTWRLFNAPSTYLGTYSSAYLSGTWLFNWTAFNSSSGGIYSTDGGTTPSLSIAFPGISGVVPLGDSSVAAYKAGVGYLYATQDGGQTWSGKYLSDISTINLLYQAGPTVVHDSGSSLRIVQTNGTASVTLTASATATGGIAVSYQWQSSVDAGATWANVSGATSATLSLSNLTTANSGTRYRAAASATGVATVFSQSATLTVSG